MTKNSEILDKILKSSNLLPLAFVGDSVHTLFIREKVLQQEHTIANYHLKASKYCKASAQANALQKIMPFLSEGEKEIVRRARNAKPKHTAKNATSADYCYATAFEALIGYLYLLGSEKLEEILNLSYQKEEGVE